MCPLETFAWSFKRGRHTQKKKSWPTICSAEQLPNRLLHPSLSKRGRRSKKKKKKKLRGKKCHGKSSKRTRRRQPPRRIAFQLSPSIYCDSVPDLPPVVCRPFSTIFPVYERNNLKNNLNRRKDGISGGRDSA